MKIMIVTEKKSIAASIEAILKKSLPRKRIFLRFCKTGTSDGFRSSAFVGGEWNHIGRWKANRFTVFAN